MRDEFFNGFFAAWIFFALSFALYLAFNEPSKMQRDAVRNGSAKWIIEIKDDFPTIKFEWIKKQ